MIPDFAQKVIVAHHEFLTKANKTATTWKDPVQESFYQTYVEKFNEYLELYIKGGTNSYSMGLDELLTFLDRKEQEMNSIHRM